MSGEQLRRYIGCRILDGQGRPLGRVVGITHHDGGGASALVSQGPWPWSEGMHVRLDGALLSGDVVRLGGELELRPALPGRS